MKVAKTRDAISSIAVVVMLVPSLCLANLNEKSKLVDEIFELNHMKKLFTSFVQGTVNGFSGEFLKVAAEPEKEKMAAALTSAKAACDPINVFADFRSQVIASADQRALALELEDGKSKESREYQALIDSEIIFPNDVKAKIEQYMNSAGKTVTAERIELVKQVDDAASGTETLSNTSAVMAQEFLIGLDMVFPPGRIHTLTEKEVASHKTVYGAKFRKDVIEAHLYVFRDKSDDYVKSVLSSQMRSHSQHVTKVENEASLKSLGRCYRDFGRRFGIAVLTGYAGK